MATLLRSSRSFLITGFDFEGRMECTSDTVSGLKWPRDPNSEVWRSTEWPNDSRSLTRWI